MGITIEELNAKYKKEDSAWDFSLFPAWLEKKGIPNSKDVPIVAVTLEQVLIEFNLDNLPDTHHEFDNLVLKMAVENRTKLNKELLSLLDKGVQESLKKYDSDWYAQGKLRKIFRVIRGKD